MNLFKDNELYESKFGSRLDPTFSKNAGLLSWFKLVCAGWSEPLLVTHATLLEISCCR